jgi:tRNA(Ile2) C34 agmatinyltransferase TiaS
MAYGAVALRGSGIYGAVASFNISLWTRSWVDPSVESFATGVSRTREEESIMSNTVAEKTTTRTDRCHRCGGLMVTEEVFEIRSIDFRCVSCGERIDAVILAPAKRKVAFHD